MARIDDTGVAGGRRRGSRFWLFAPFVVVGLVIVAWAAAWFVIRDRAATEIDAALAREAAAGRVWTCADRTIRGFPFRIEVSCASLALARADGVTLTVGPTTAVAQVYQPRHVIVESRGPLRASDGAITIDGTWSLLEASVRGIGRGSEQVAIVAENAQVRAGGALPQPLEVSGERFEAYLRPSPQAPGGRPGVDLLLRASNAKAPALDPLTGNDAPARLEVQARATDVRGLPGGSFADTLDAWRDAGGAVDLALIDVLKGPTHVQLKGRLALDAQRRPAGRVEISAAGVDGILASVLGSDRAGFAGAMLGALTGGRPAPGADPALRPLPPLRLAEGRVYVGPLALPQVRVAPLY